MIEEGAVNAYSERSSVQAIGSAEYPLLKVPRKGNQVST